LGDLNGEQTNVNTRDQIAKAAIAYRDVEAKSWAVVWIDLGWNVGGGTPAEEAMKKKAMQSLQTTLEKSLKDLEDALKALKPGGANTRLELHDLRGAVERLGRNGAATAQG